MLLRLINSSHRAGGTAIGTQVDVDDDPHAMSLKPGGGDVPREAP